MVNKNNVSPGYCYITERRVDFDKAVLSREFENKNKDIIKICEITLRSLYHNKLQYIQMGCI